MISHYKTRQSQGFVMVMMMMLAIMIQIRIRMVRMIQTVRTVMMVLVVVVMILLGFHPITLRHFNKQQLVLEISLDPSDVLSSCLFRLMCYTCPWIGCDGKCCSPRQVTVSKWIGVFSSWRGKSYEKLTDRISRVEQVRNLQESASGWVKTADESATVSEILTLNLPLPK